jgi:hypothetical protein
VGCDSLQSPYDTGATYSGAKKAKGYKLQIVETCTRVRKEDLDVPALNLVLYVKSEGAHNSDVHAFQPIVEELKRLGIEVKTVLADNAYNSIENHELAARNGIELIGPANNGHRLPEAKPGQGSGEPPEAPPISLTDFNIDDKGLAVSCPEGQTASSRLSAKGDACNAAFDKAVCSACSRLGQCPVKDSGGENMRMRYTFASLDAAKNRARNGSKASKKQYRQRSGVEGTNSEMKRGPGVGKLRIRGPEKVAHTASMKAAGTNILRVNNYRKEMRKLEKRKARRTAA